MRIFQVEENRSVLQDDKDLKVVSNLISEMRWTETLD